MDEIKFLLAMGFKFEQIAHASGLPIMAVYRAYLGTRTREIGIVYDFYKHTGRLPVPARSNTPPRTTRAMR